MNHYNSRFVFYDGRHYALLSSIIAFLINERILSSEVKTI